MQQRWIEFFFGHPVRTIVIVLILMALLAPGALAAALCQVFNEFKPLISLGIVVLVFLAVFRRL